MLAKKFRLSHQQFLLAKKQSKQISSPDLSMQVSVNGLTVSRFAVVTSTKLDKRAVRRNRLRRQIYTHFQNTTLIGLDIILFPKRSMLNLTNAELGTKIDSLLPKIPGLD